MSMNPASLSLQQASRCSDAVPKVLNYTTTLVVLLCVYAIYVLIVHKLGELHCKYLMTVILVAR